MAVRESLLTLLATGENYGFRLHNELTTRVPYRAELNVGQSYATLDRLNKAELIESAGLTADGLPLYRLRPSGTAIVKEWLAGSDAPGSQREHETVERVLLSASLGALLPASVGRFEDILQREKDSWNQRDRVVRESSQSEGLWGLEYERQRLLAHAMIEWLDKVSATGRDQLIRPFSSDRPRRGRPRKSIRA